jgi:hypothetical protein
MTASRSLANRIGGYAYRAKHGDAQIARLGADALLARFEREVDPDASLPESERRRRAEAARKAHMARLALKSAVSRASRKGSAKSRDRSQRAEP